MHQNRIHLPSTSGVRMFRVIMVAGMLFGVSALADEFCKGFNDGFISGSCDQRKTTTACKSSDNVPSCPVHVASANVYDGIKAGDKAGRAVLIRKIGAELKAQGY